MITAFYPIVISRILNKRMPFLAAWEITHRCNCRCIYCGSWTMETAELPLHDVMSIVDKLKNIGIKVVHITGGEPLIRKDLDVIIRYIHKKGMAVSISSNGLLVERRIDSLKKVENLTISLDGDEYVHNKIRGIDVQGSALKALSLAIRYGIKVRISTVLSSINCSDSSIEYVLCKARTYNAPANFSLAFDFCLKSEKANPIVMNYEQKKNIINRLISLKKGKYKRNIGNSLAGLQYLMHWPNVKPIKCEFEKLALRITAKGDMLPCNVIHTYSKINILSDNFYENFIRQPLAGCCKGCICINRVELNLMLNGNINSILNNFFNI